MQRELVFCFNHNRQRKTKNSLKNLIIINNLYYLYITHTPDFELKISGKKILMYNRH